MGHVDVHCASVAEVFVAPDHVEQFVAFEHQAHVLDKREQKVELFTAEFDRPAVNFHFVAGGVNAGVAYLDRLPRRERYLRACCRAAQDSLDPGNQFSGVEWLRDIIVRAQFEAHDLVNIVAAGGEHDDGYLALATNAPAYLPTVNLGEHDVE